MEESIDENTEVTPELLQEKGLHLGDVDDEITAAIYLYGQALHFAFGSPLKTVPKHTVIMDIDEGSILKNQAWNLVPYNVHSKSIVFCNGEVGKLHEYCGKVVTSVWGRSFSVSNKGVGVVVGPRMAQGKPIDLHWTPPNHVSKKPVEKLLKLDDVEAIFKFGFHPEEGGIGMQLAPEGLIIRTAKKISANKKVQVLSILPK